MPEVQRVAVVTGASSGIGRATAVALVAAGFTVVGTSRTPAAAAPQAGVTFIDLDVSREESVEALVAEVLEGYGRIDVLVNNAGVGSVGAAEELSVEQHRGVFDINVLGVIRMSKAVLPIMRAQGSGRIVNVSSVLGLVPQPFMAAYVASKHAVEGWSQSVDHEIRQDGVRMVLVEPAFTNTEFDAKAIVADDSQPVYATRRATFDGVMAQAMAKGDDPTVVAAVVVEAATAAKPKLRYTAGPLAGRVSVLRRWAPARMFDGQIRKLNKMAS